MVQGASLPPLVPPEEDQTDGPEEEIRQPNPILRVIFRLILPDGSKHDEGEIEDSNEEAEHESGGRFPPLRGNAEANAHQSQGEAGEGAAEAGVVFGEGLGAQLFAILVVFHAVKPSARLLARRGLAQGGVKLRIAKDFLQLAETHAVHAGSVGFLPKFG